MNIPPLSLGLWLFLNSIIAKHSPEEHWLSLEACSTLVEKDDPDLLLCISSLSSHLCSSVQFPSGQAGPCPAGVWLCQSRPVALQPWWTADQPGRTNLARSLALLLSLTPHNESHFPLPLPAQGIWDQGLAWKGPWSDLLQEPFMFSHAVLKQWYWVCKGSFYAWHFWIVVPKAGKWL